MSVERAQVMAWLGLAEIEFELCDDCEGLHMPDLQAHEAVIESRLFVENEWVMFVTEVEILPSALFNAMAKMAEFNLRLPTLKVFLDVVDDALPKMIMTHSIFTVNSVSPDQLVTFVKATQDAMSYALQFAEQFELVAVEDPEQLDLSMLDNPTAGGMH
ncbi:YbjN domain-containing protein [Salinibius halmophilus]|uniref:YbjN domain-containing protein n=1 Tax=Salinibius halmophilus TaxID=1853216 RepID=UPI000E66E8A4|nr:YbjN domain-containing protein [Salinibius halmophilus]